MLVVIEKIRAVGALRRTSAGIKQIMILAFITAFLAGCAESFEPTHKIHAVTREEGSGTRTAFCEPLGLSEDSVDIIHPDIAVSSSTAVVISYVEKNCHAIGYISFASISEGVRAVGIDGTLPSIESITDGSYPLVRPFFLVYRRENSAAQALVDFILSEDGQNTVQRCGYAPAAPKATDYGAVYENVSVSGSSSVYPLMEQIREDVICAAPDICFDLQQSDSSSGIAAVRDGICDIGMMSRLPTGAELGNELTYAVIALDGIAVIVSQNNPTDNLTSEQLRQIYSGEVTAWGEI